MHLQRLYTSAKHEQELTDWQSDGSNAFINFEKFGNGPDNFSYFKVLLTWKDVEAIIDGMADKNHSQALRVRHALQLAQAIENISENSK